MHPYIRGQLKQVSLARNAVFAGLARNRPLSNNYEGVGLEGEFEFGRFCGLMPRMKPGRGGDGGYDFELPVVFTVDVKTSRKADVLLVESGKVKADIYVLAKYDDEETICKDDGELVGTAASLLGWCWSTHVKSKPPVDTGRGIVNHAIPVEELRPMEELQKMMGKVKRV